MNNLRRPCGGEWLLLSLLAQAATAQSPPPRESFEPLQATIDAAIRSGQKSVTIPPGTYRIQPPAAGAHLRFANLSGFTIDAAGVDLVFTDQTREGIEFRNCRNVTVRGLRVRYEVPPFTQGVVATVAPGGDWYDVHVDPYYPVNVGDPAYFPAAPVGYIFDADRRRIRSGSYDLNEQRSERRSSDTIRIYRRPASGPGIQPVMRGDVVAFRGAGPHNIVLIGCAGMRLDGVTVFNAASFAVFESGGDGGNFYRLTVTRGPPPPKATTRPLFSSTADAFHSADVRRGPTLEDCHFDSMGDDGIAIHGHYSLVMQARGNQLVVSRGAFLPGDPVRLLDSQNRPAGETTIRGVKPLVGFASSQKSHRDTQSDFSTGPYFELTLAHALPAAFDDLVSDPAASGQGYVLSRNTISNHRARGMLLKAGGGVVENNLIDGSTMGGIVLTPEFWWGESGFSRKVVIRGNTIRNVGRAPDQLGGVVVGAFNPAPVSGCGHQNITIENNQFEEINGVNLLITSACSITVRNNRFLRTQRESVHAAGEEWGEDPGDVIYAAETKMISFIGNRVSEPGRFFRTLLYVRAAR